MIRIRSILTVLLAWINSQAIDASQAGSPRAPRQAQRASAHAARPSDLSITGLRPVFAFCGTVFVVRAALTRGPGRYTLRTALQSAAISSAAILRGSGGAPDARATRAKRK